MKKALHGMMSRIAQRTRNYVLSPVRMQLDDQALVWAQWYMTQRSKDPADQPNGYAWKVFSQFGEDGIIDFLIRSAAHAVPRTFIEFGVEDYREANTRFLCEQGDWRGLIIDPDIRHIDFARERRLIAHRGLRCVQAFLTIENIDDVILSAGFANHIGVLSVDVDGVDYWLIDALRAVCPVLIIAEYNPYFGPEAAVTVPYDRTFMRRNRHPSGVYYGASISALHALGVSRGYRLVAVSPEGLNLFFVREDYCRPTWGMSPQDGYRPPAFSPAMLADGTPFSQIPLPQALAPVAHLPLFDIDRTQSFMIRDLIIQLEGAQRK